MNPVDLQTRVPSAATLTNPVFQSLEGLFAKVLGDIDRGGVSAEAIAIHQDARDPEASHPSDIRAPYEDRRPAENPEVPDAQSSPKAPDQEATVDQSPEHDQPHDDPAAGGEPEDDYRDDSPTDGTTAPERQSADDDTAPEDGGETAATEAGTQEETAGDDYAETIALVLPDVAASAAVAAVQGQVNPAQSNRPAQAANPAATASPTAIDQSSINSALHRDPLTQAPQQAIGAAAEKAASGATTGETAAPRVPNTSAQGLQTAQTAGARAQGEAPLQVTVNSSAQVTGPNGPLKGLETITSLQDTGAAAASGTATSSLAKDSQGANPFLANTKASNGEQGQGQASSQNGGQQQLLQQTMIGARLQNSAGTTPGTAGGSGNFAGSFTGAAAAASGAGAGAAEAGALTPSGQALPLSAGQPRGLIQAAAQSAAADLLRGATTPKDPAAQVAIQVSKGARAGQDRISVQLHPAELGRIEVKMQFDDLGQLRALVSAEKSDTLELLQRDSRALEKALQDAGVKTDSNSLSFQKGQERNSGQQAQGSQAQNADAGGPEAQNANGVDGDTVQPARIHDGNLDIEV